jgi:hypothetical protein
MAETLKDPRTGLFVPKAKGEIVVVKSGAVEVPSGYKLTKIAAGALGAVRREAVDQKHTLYAWGSVGLLSALDAKGMLAEVPTIAALGRYGTAALASYGVSKFLSKNQLWRHVTTGMGSVAIHYLTRSLISGQEVAELEGGAPVVEESEESVTVTP